MKIENYTGNNKYGGVFRKKGIYFYTKFLLPWSDCAFQEEEVASFLVATTTTYFALETLKNLFSTPPYCFAVVFLVFSFLTHATHSYTHTHTHLSCYRELELLVCLSIGMAFNQK
jgi:hypothetical protein